MECCSNCVVIGIVCIMTSIMVYIQLLLDSELKMGSYIAI